jgi:hypothetical protein
MTAANHPAADLQTASAALPLVLDVDDTLIRTDLLHETAVAYFRANPLRVFNLVLWTLQGKATLKRKLSEQVPIDVDSLPVNEELVAFARAEHDKGRSVGLATAADELLALRLARRFDFIDFTIGSNGTRNLKGANKAAALVERFPEGFAYAGDGRRTSKSGTRRNRSCCRAHRPILPPKRGRWASRSRPNSSAPSWACAAGSRRCACINGPRMPWSSCRWCFRAWSRTRLPSRPPSAPLSPFR